MLVGGAAHAAIAQTAPLQISAQWQLTGQSTNGHAQQYVDLNSIQQYGSPEQHQWRVASYFTERKADEQVRADYITLYDCDRQRYKDINADGIPALDWGSAAADPLNQATLEFVCERVQADGN